MMLLQCSVSLPLPDHQLTTSRLQLALICNTETNIRTDLTAILPQCLSKKVRRDHGACSNEQLLKRSTIDAWPSSKAFDMIAEALSEESERKDAIKKGGAIFAFTLKNDKGDTADWFVDLKETGKVGKGTAPEGKKPGGEFSTYTKGYLRTIMARRADLSTVTMILSDVDWAKLISGKANAQKLFMSGKLKIKGDVMKATKIEPVLKKVQQQDWAKL